MPGPIKQLQLRLPYDLFLQVQAEAERMKVSRNQLMITLIERGLNESGNKSEVGETNSSSSETDKTGTRANS